MMNRKEKTLRTLIIVGNDLRGDSRVEKIVMASVRAHRDVFVVAKKSMSKGKLPISEVAKLIKIDFDPNYECLDYGNRLGSYVMRCVLRSRLFLYRIKNNFSYKCKRGIYRLKQTLGNLLYDQRFPNCLISTRNRLLKPRRARIEEKKLLTPPQVLGLNALDFNRYISVMHSWYLPAAIRVKPDLIHANDADTLRIGVSVKDYWAARGHNVALVYDAHEYTAGVFRPDPTWLPAMLYQEALYIDKADYVITVSEAISELLQADFGLTHRPAVILNAPSAQTNETAMPFPKLRVSLGLDSATPLFTYVGVSSPARGIHTVVEALVHYPEAHFALVTRSTSYVNACAQDAIRNGVEDRFHIVPYVPHQWVSNYISDSTAGINPAIHHPNHELSCSTKYYEYVHARLPIVMSDLQVMAQTTREHKIGEVFEAENAVDCARAMKLVGENPQVYSKNITAELINLWSWEEQEKVLNSTYAKAISRSKQLQVPA
jgi:glycosyltransferase involved in cell wall biosynthesis